MKSVCMLQDSLASPETRATPARVDSLATLASLAQQVLAKELQRQL